MKRVNLLPSNLIDPEATRTRRARPSRSTRIAAVIAPIWVVAAFVHITHLNEKTRIARIKLNDLQNHAQKTELIIAECEKLAAYLASMQNISTDIPTTAAISLLTSRATDGVRFESLTVKNQATNPHHRSNKQATPDRLSISLIAAAEADGDLAYFIGALTDSPYLWNVQSRQAPTRTAGAEQRITISMDLAAPSQTGATP